MKTLIISLFILILTGCSSNNNPVAGGEKDAFGGNERLGSKNLTYIVNARNTYNVSCDSYLFQDYQHKYVLGNDTVVIDMEIIGSDTNFLTHEDITGIIVN